MILSTHLLPDKSLDPVRLKEQESEPHESESCMDAAEFRRAMSHLHESGWYWGSVTAVEAKQILSDAPEGTFLVRDSCCRGYVLTLSMKTNLGPTHLRIEYTNGLFGFHSVKTARPRLQRFGGAVDLVQHYALAYKHLASQKREGGPQKEGVSENSLQMKLTRPLCRVFPSLQHLCRMTINQHFCHFHHSLPLPERLKGFLLEYPFVL